MPKDIILPKENYKKVEEIREIKNEIPTYEEFLKNYEADRKVSESYENEIESYSNIEAPKGYGPCYVCYKDTQWVGLRIPCAAVGCDDMTPICWYHTPGCGSGLEVSNKAKVRCSGCSFTCDLKDYRFSCSNHLGDYRSVGQDSLHKSMSVMFSMGGVSQTIKDLNIYMVNHRW